ncbi:MAG: carboxypeptidase regulatory-like domain-containing protein [Myxococcota bacterium]|nr:carboxypeptidase regulatory-like domain-containing protein [Myxococcota bacterium]
MRWLAALVVAGGLLASAAAAPQVEIKAQTQLSLGSVRLLGDGTVVVTGQLVDKLTSEGLDHQAVTVRVGTRQGSAYTDPDGTFRVTLVAETGPQPVELAFRGTASLDRAEPITIVTDPSRAQVALSLRAEPAPGGVTVVVSSAIDDKPATVSVDLHIGGATEPDLTKLTTLTTGTPFLVTRAAAGGPGPRRLRATFAGDDARQHAAAEATVELTSATTTTLKVSSKQLAYEDELVATGRVVDEDGAPVARAAVTLTAGDRRLSSGATAADGTYRFEVEAEILGPGQFGVWVQSDPGTSYIRPSKSEPAILEIAAPQPVPVSYTIAAFLATALAAGGFFLARSKPWLRFRRPAPPAEAPEKDGELDVVDGGLVVAKPSLVSTLRRPNDEGFSGVVRDTVRGRPVADAVVRIVLGDVAQELRTEADGSFTIEALAAGEWRAAVAAPGHVTEQFAVTIPHRGELRGVRVDLVPVRERVFQLYRRAAEPALPEARLWGIWSPRQIVDHVRSRRQSPALAELTDFVEEVYFSSRLAGEAELPGASDRVDRAIRERTRVAG